MMPAALLSELANHIWQSTVFALAAGVLVLALRKNHARTRYWIWWIASLKFLVPFSLLVTVGSRLSGPVDVATPVEPSTSAVVIEYVAQPFTPSEVRRAAPRVAESAPASEASALPAILLTAWLCGVALMLARWSSRWRRVRALAAGRQSLEGRELEVLRRLERETGSRCPLPMRTSGAAIEPCAVGPIRPVLIWPAGFTGKLDDAELKAILLHELSHVRRRDNLTAAVHMLVECVFWFHPLVWWLGARLVDEREKACDEDVLRGGGGAHDYAEGILKVCEFCIASPLPCAAGVTGADLKRRIEEIVKHRGAVRLSFGMALLLAVAAMAALAGPIAFGVVFAARTQSGLPTSPPPAPPSQVAAIPAVPMPPPAVPRSRRQERETFEVVSIRPNTGGGGGGQRSPGPGARGGGPVGASPCGGMVQLSPGRVVMVNVSLYRLITVAYGKHCRLSTEQELLAGGPAWIGSSGFDIQATLPEGFPVYTQQQLANGEAPRLQALIRNLLADRFRLALHPETKEVPIYNITLVKMANFRMSEDQTPVPPVPPGARPPEVRPGDPPPRGSFGVRVDPSGGLVTVNASAIPMSTFINFMQGTLSRMAIDETGVTGLIDIPEQTFNVGPYEIAPGAVSVWPEIFRQLGLNMEAARGPVEMLVIDRAEKPSEN